MFVPLCRKHGAVFQSELQLTGAYTGAYVSDWLQIVRRKLTTSGWFSAINGHVAPALHAVAHCAVLQRVVQLLQRVVQLLQRVVQLLQRVVQLLQRVVQLLQRVVQLLQRVVQLLQRVGAAVAAHSRIAAAAPLFIVASRRLRIGQCSR
jgi:hypothetical protein